MRAHDQSSIFSTGEKFRPDYGLQLELHTLTLVTRSYALLFANVEDQHKERLLVLVKETFVTHPQLSKISLLS